MSGSTGAAAGAPPAVKTVEKALRVLLHLGAARRELSLGDVARGVGLHPSTTHRLLSVLARHGFPQGGAARGHYVRGLRLPSWGSSRSTAWSYEPRRDRSSKG